MKLTDFLLARIAEDEHEANQALGLMGIETEWHRVEVLRERGLTRADAQHVHRWSSRRVLAECEAKRRIVEEVHHAVGGTGFDAESCEGCCWARPTAKKLVVPLSKCPTLRLLALPYADHPDYDPSWAV